jgi:predicted esterase
VVGHLLPVSATLPQQGAGVNGGPDARRAAWPAIALCASFVWCCAPLHTGTPASRPGVSLRRVEVATEPVERDALAQIPGMRADRVELALAVPASFDAARPHPILITQVTAGNHRTNIEGLEQYAATALAQGYVVLTAQGLPWNEGDQSHTLMHRYASVRAALSWLDREIPHSSSWPIVLAGFSGGAKIIQVLAVSLTLEQRRVAGLFLGGCNESHAGVLLAQYPAIQPRFAQIAFFLSAGKDDRIAPLSAVRTVAQQLRDSGVEHLELSVHAGGHRLDLSDLSRALSWFRTQL